jgi:hypothetical protein
VRRLVRTLNRVVIENGERGLPDKDLDEVYELFWPTLKNKLTSIRDAAKRSVPLRGERDLLDEILSILRAQEQRERKREADQIFRRRVSEQLRNAQLHRHERAEKAALTQASTEELLRRYTKHVAEEPPGVAVPNLVEPLPIDSGTRKAE